MSALVLDAGALMGVDRDDRAMIARLRVAQRHGMDLRSNAMVVAQVWRDRQGRQVQLANLLHAVDIRAVDQRAGRDAGALLAIAGSADPIHATVALLAQAGDRVLTRDPADLTLLLQAANRPAVVVVC